MVQSTAMSSKDKSTVLLSLSKTLESLTLLSNQPLITFSMFRTWVQLTRLATLMLGLELNPEAVVKKRVTLAQVHLKLKE